MQAVINSEDKRLIELEKSRFKSMLIAAHPQFADSILKEDEERESDVAEGFDYDTFDEDADHTLTAEDYAAMAELTGMISNIEERGYDMTEYE